MFYKKHTAVAVVIVVVMMLETLFVCAKRPYSASVWLSASMMAIGCIALGVTTVCLRDKPDSSFPVSVTAAVVTFYYVIAVAVLSIIPIFDVGLPFKYYALAHLVLCGILSIMLVVYRMWVRMVDKQDVEFQRKSEFRHFDIKECSDERM